MKPSKNKFFTLLFIAIFTVVLESNFFSSHFYNSSFSVASEAQSFQIKQQGQQIIINQRKVDIPWIQWQEGQKTHIGISDLGAEKVLGIELLATSDSKKQPIHWFNYYKTLRTKFVNPYRYLDLTDLQKSTPIRLTVKDEILRINLPPSQINKAYEVPELKGKKIIIELDRPSFFQVSQGRDQGIITIDSQANADLLEQFKPEEDLPPDQIEEDEGDQITGAENQAKEKPLFSMTSQDKRTMVTINLPPAHHLRVNSANPSLLFVELKPEAIVEKDIVWSNDIYWQKKYVRLNSSSNSPKNSLFLVDSLTLNLSDYNLDILPITTNGNTVIGTAPLVKTAQQLEAIAAINGGFFNRNNKLPLGALKQQENWLSGPILNRGVIAWDEVGRVKIGRLELQETISTAMGDRFVSNYLNSGYIQPGISRYTPSWGMSYTTLSDDEIVIVVEDDLIKQQIVAAQAGEHVIAIPSQGYLLVLRKAENLASKLAVDQKIKVNTLTVPADFAKYPYIMGAGPLLLLNRQIVLDGEAEKFSKAFNQQKASRSAIAVNSEGKLMFVAVHHRIGGAGPSLEELAQILQNIGAVSALNLDGGSSTQIYLGGQIIDRSAATAARVNNGIGVFLRKRY